MDVIFTIVLVLTNSYVSKNKLSWC